MNVSLSPELERFIQEKVDSKLYQTASEVVREALRLLEREDREREAKLEALRRDLKVAEDQIARGEYIEVKDPKAFLREIQRRGRARLQAAAAKAAQNQ